MTYHRLWLRDFATAPEGWRLRRCWGYNDAMRYSLRTLLMLTIMGPPVLAVCYYVWHPPSNFDIVELRLLAVAVIFAGLAAAGGIAVVWRSGKPT